MGDRTYVAESEHHKVYVEPHHERGAAAVCGCGWVAWHQRPKVLIRKAERHVTKRGETA